MSMWIFLQVMWIQMMHITPEIACTEGVACMEGCISGCKESNKKCHEKGYSIPFLY